MPKEFLQALRPGGPWVLTAIAPDGPTITTTARTPPEIEAFVRQHDGVRNLYYAVNPLRRGLTTKARKPDIASVEYLHADLDPNAGESADAAKTRYREALKKEPLPTFVIDSGNGLQCLWRLDAQITDLSAERIADVEARGKALVERLGAKAGTQNIDRILRLPGTVNLPNRKKQREGRVKCSAKLIEQNDVAHALANGDGRTHYNGSSKLPAINFADLPDVDVDALSITKEIKDAIRTDGADIAKGDRSKGLAHVTRELVRAGLTDLKIGSVIWSNEIGAHCHDQANPERAIRRAIAHARRVVAMAADEFNAVETKQSTKRKRAEWLSRCLSGGRVLNNLASALRALRDDPAVADCFAYDEMLRMPLLTKPLPGMDQEPIVPRPITDADVSALQEWLQNAGLERLGKDIAHQAVDKRAHERSFHPVRDYLDGLRWDGKPRLGSWLSNYLGAEQTPNSEGIGAMFLIALVARIYEPGCKADFMMILEGAQGDCKSTACATLGGPWFSDHMPPVTSGSKDVSEHLSGKWLIEVAEMAAMTRTESDALKHFVSRPVEQYRPPYGRKEVKQPRQCLFVGTTNREAYLRDETGGRRFWPVKCGHIDLRALRRDRDQLFAEAVARYVVGDPWWPDGDFEAAHIRSQQEDRFEVDAWEEIVVPWLSDKTRVQVTEVARDCVGLAAPKIGTTEQRRITAILLRAGWRRIRDWKGRAFVAAATQHDAHHDAMNLRVRHGPSL